MNERLTVKELAARLRRSVRYVFYMKSRGFKMVGGMATLAEALAWIARNPKPTGCCKAKEKLRR
jgi:hypothetical protein